VDEAEDVVADMERSASRRGPLREPAAAVLGTDEPAAGSARGAMPYRDILLNPMYLRRVLLLVLVWLIAYVTVYGFSAGFTSVLTAQGYAPPEAGVIVAVGAFGFLLCAVAAVLFGERLPRKVWLPISAAITIAGSIIVAAAGDTLGLAMVGAGIIFFGFNLWVPMTYARSAESFPTRARTTGFALVDGVGHLGGGIGVLLIAPAIPDMSILGALLLISAFLVVAAVLASFGVETRNRRFEEVSP
jgi:MFS transporter, putative metabolite:H+ symporter